MREKIIKIRKYILNVVIVCLVIFLSNNILASSYIYDISNNNQDKLTDESSISTIAEPEFTFQSESQILMEPTTGKILYANNEDEKLLPASVTKVMTMLLTMEQIDSR